MIEEEAIGKIRKSETDAVTIACNALRSHNVDMKSCLVELVASICDISVDEMRKNTKKLECVQARWFFWYSYRQLTREGLRSTTNHVSDVYRVTQTGVAKAVRNMSMFIAENTIWTRRWQVMKRLINAVSNCTEQEIFPETITVSVTAPKGVNVEIKQV